MMTNGALNIGNLSTPSSGHESSNLIPILQRVIDEYRRNFGTGLIDAILLIDEDAKVLAGASPCDMGNSIYDLGILSAALFGIAAEGKDRFGCEDLSTCLLTWKDRQIFIQSIGAVKANGDETGRSGGRDTRRRERRLILSALTDERVNIGLMRIKMREVAGEILRLVSISSPAMRLLNAKEEEIEKMIKNLSSEIAPID
jgi:predicted regulator of Ras-like GTPase activity (Roadblock/LC7/MglB family)